MKTLVKAILLMLLSAAVACAGDTGKGEGFWAGLMKKLQKVTPTRKSTATTAVGGVRGAKNEDAAEIYWKGKEKTAEIGEDELEKFRAAVETKNRGENALALKEFEQFLVDFPKSSFRPECLEAMTQLKAELNLPAQTAR